MIFWIPTSPLTYSTKYKIILILILQQGLFIDYEINNNLIRKAFVTKALISYSETLKKSI